MAERYLAIVLVRPDDEGAVRRLIERAASRAGGIDALVAELRARSDELGTGSDLALAAIALLRADDAGARASIARALERSPDSVVARILLARLEQRAGARDRAAAALTEASGLERDAARRDAILRDLAALLLDLGRVDEARELYAQLARGGSVLARTELVRALAAHGRCADAMRDFPDAERAAARDASASVGLVLLRARCEAELGEPEAARATLSRGWPSALRASRAPELLDAMVALARSTDGLVPLSSELAQLGPSAALHHGVVLEELGRDAEALAIFRAVLSRQPRDAETRQRVVRLLSRNGRMEEALDERRSLARLFPERIALTLELASALRDQGRDAESLAVLDRARARARRDRTALFLLVDAYASHGDRDRVLETLEAIVRASPDDPRALTALANEVLERGDRERALALLDRVARGASDEVSGELEAARAFANLRIFDRALAHLEAAVRARPEAPEVLDAQAEILERAGRDDDAERALARRIELGVQPGELDDQAVVEAETRLVASWARRGRLAAHRPELEAGHQRGDARASRMLADLLRRVGEVDRAVATLDALAVRAPDDIRLHTSLARLHHERGDYDAEVRILRRLAELEPARAGWHYTRLVELALAAYRDEDAIAFAEEAARRSVDDAGLELRLGRLHARRRDPSRAAAAYARALTIDPDSFEAAWELASIEREAGRGRRAIELYLDILERSRDDELRDRAGRAALEASRADGTEASLEPRLLSLALSHGEAPVFRRLALGLYASLSGSARARGDSAELERWVSRALPVLLASLRDPDVGARASARQLLFAHPVPGAAAALVALASDDEIEPGVRASALAAGIRVASARETELLLELVTGPQEGLAVLALHGLARVLGAVDRARLLRELRASEGRLADHAWAWTLLLGGREVPDAPPASSTAPWLTSWHAALSSEAPAPRAPTPPPARAAASALSIELGASGWLTDGALDELASRALGAGEGSGPRALERLVSSATPAASCAPALERTEGLDAWMLRVVEACPRRPREPERVAAALERGALAVPEAGVIRALERVSSLAAPHAELALPAARALAGRLLPVGATSAEGAIALVRAASTVPGLLADEAWRELLGHPEPHARAAAAAGAPLPTLAAALVGAVRSDPSWAVRRAALNRLRALPREAGELEVVARVGLEDPVSYVRSAALALARELPAGSACPVLAERLPAERDPIVLDALRAALAACTAP